MEKKITTKKTAQGSLLEEIWKKFGGPSDVAKKCGLQLQSPWNWVKRGKVPLSRVAEIVQGLSLTDTQKWGLNYLELSLILGDKPTWNKVVESFDFPKDVRDRILFYAPPGAKKKK